MFERALAACPPDDGWQSGGVSCDASGSGPTIFRPSSSCQHSGFLPALLALCLLGTGCKTYTRQSEAMTAAWAAGDIDQAAKLFGDRAERKTDSSDAVIWELEAGAAFRATGDLPASNREFDAAAARIAAYEKTATVKLSRETAALFSNQQSLPYEGRSYDKILLRTYRALNYLELGQPDRARPELIRAYQRQQDAVVENRRRIEQAREAAQNSEQAAIVSRSEANPGFQAALGQLTQPLDRFQFYADYVNPFTVYLDGLFFLHAGDGGSDLERALKSLHRVQEACRDNPAVRADVAFAEAVAAGQSFQQPRLTYVLFETGRAASREQVRIDVPIIITDISYVGVAFPRLVFHPEYDATLTIVAGTAPQTTVLIANVDAIIAQDFKNALPAIVTRTLLGVLAKGAAAWAVNDAARRQDEDLGLLARLLTAAVQAAVNIADTRSWTTLPKQFQVARFNTPPDRRITVTAPSGVNQHVTLIDGEVNVVYVKSISAGGPLFVSQFKLE